MNRCLALWMRDAHKVRSPLEPDDTPECLWDCPENAIDCQILERRERLDAAVRTVLRRHPANMHDALVFIRSDPKHVKEIIDMHATLGLEPILIRAIRGEYERRTYERLSALKQLTTK